MRWIFMAIFAAMVGTVDVACAQAIPAAIVVISDDTFPAAIIPSTPGSTNECYVEQRGTLRTEGMEQSVPVKYSNVRTTYVAVIFSPPATPQHPLTCKQPTRLWVPKDKMLRMIEQQRPKF